MPDKQTGRFDSSKRLRGWPLLCLLLLFGAPGVRAATLNVFAAASLTESMKAVATAYEKQSGDKIVFNLGASSLLERQIEEGAPADLFFSADEAKMDALEKKGLLLAGTRKSLLSNSLVIVVPLDSSLHLASAADLSRPDVKRLALADTQAVPAGIYARQFLEKAGVWDAVRGKVIPTDNVRAALAAVESGNVDAGMVYKTDAAISKRVKIAYEVPIQEGPAIRYPVASLKESKEPDAARKFLKFLESETAARVFEQHGFIVLRSVR